MRGCNHHSIRYFLLVIAMVRSVAVSQTIMIAQHEMLYANELPWASKILYAECSIASLP